MGRSLYALSQTDTLALQSKPHDDIVATGPWVRGACEMPHRIVLRNDGRDLIVHLQVINVDDGYAFFTHGNYFPCPVSVDPGEPLTDSWTTFEDRVRRCLDIGPRPLPTPEDESDDESTS